MKNVPAPISLACALALFFFPISVRSSPEAIQPIEFDKLVKDYVADGLPIPPEQAPLIRVKTGTKSLENGHESYLYVLGFLLSKNETEHTADVLIGSYRDHLNTQEYPVEVVDPQHVTLDDISADYMFRTPFDLNTGFATALQCHARGYTNLDQNLMKLSFSDINLSHGDGGAVRSTASWMNPRANVAQVESTPKTSLEDMLAALAWNHWMNEMLRPESDWNMIASRYETLLTTHPFLVDEPRQALLASIKAALVPSKAQPGSIDAEIDKLVLISGSWGDMNPKAAEADALYTNITAHGFEAVPVLIQHLDDRRLTHSVITGFNNFRSLPRRVCDVVSDILQGIAGEDVGQDWLSRQIGNSVDKTTAAQWWKEAQKDGEEDYLKHHIINKDSNGVKLNRAQLTIIAAKYPQMLPDLCKRALQYPKLNCDDLFSAYTKSSLSKEQKIAFFTQVLGESSTETRLEALRSLIQLDRARGESELIKALKTVPHDVSGPYWLVPEVSLNRLVMETDNPQVWDAFLATTRQAKVGFRLELMNALDYSYLENRQLKQRIDFLKEFLQDSEVRRIKKTPSNQYDGPCAAFTFPVIEVRNFSAMQIGNLLQVEGETPQPNWTSEQWRKYRMRILQASLAF